MKQLLILLALLGLPLDAGAQNSAPTTLASIWKAANLRVWGGFGLGGSSFGFSSSVDLTVAKGSVAGGFMRFATASGPAGGGFGGSGLPAAERDMRGLRLGMVKSTQVYTRGIYIGLGKLSGEIPDEEYCNYFGPQEGRKPSSFFGCSRELKKTTAIAVMAELMRHSRFKGYGVKPFLIYGNSEFWPGLTLQLIVGKLR